MAIDDIGGGSGDDVQPLAFGVRVTLANTSDKIRALLPNGGRGWLLQKSSQNSSFLLRASRTTKIIKRKSAKELTSCTRADGDTVMVFVLANTNGDTGGGGNNVDSDSMSELTDVEKLTIDMANKSAAMAAYNRGEKPLQPYRPYVAGFDQDDKPSVLITKPKKDAVITRGLRGIDIEGSTVNANNLELTWNGNEAGSESQSSNDDWSGILPVRSGDYKLTATVTGGINHNVSFSVILKPAITAYTAEDIELLNTFIWGDYNESPEARLVQALAKEAGLVDKKDDFSDTTTGSNVTDKVQAFANKASGDFNLFYSGSGDKDFIDKKVTTIFGTHLSEKTKTALVDKLEAKKNAGFVDATNEFHEAMNNTLNIFFAKNSIGRTIAEMDILVSVNPTMTLMMDAAKTVVNIKLNVELGNAANGAPLLMREQARIEVFDAVAVEVVGAAVGGVVLKAGSKAFKVIKSFFGKYKFKFSKSQKLQLTADGKVIPLGKTKVDAISITNKRHAGKTVDGVSRHTGNKYKLAYDKDGFPVFESKYDMKVSNELLNNGKPKSHFKAANKQLREDLLKNPKFKDEMNLTDDQYKYFTEGKLKNGAPKDLTWHHHQDTGKMELVDYDIHDIFKHTGGMSIWGGGY